MTGPMDKVFECEAMATQRRMTERTERLLAYYRVENAELWAALKHAERRCDTPSTASAPSVAQQAPIAPSSAQAAAEAS